ncbi:MAG: methylmalonyl-CoA epimerase [Gemmatimonadaceae bacterium]
MRQAMHEGVKISHVGLAVRSIAEALPLYREIFGLEEEILAATDGARIAGVDAGGTLVELLEAESEDSPIAKFIAKRGPGIHHICFAVTDLDATLERCRKKGVRLIDDVPRAGAEGKRIAFLHPASTAGILIELTES